MKRTNPKPRVGPFHGRDLSHLPRTEPSHSILDRNRKLDKLGAKIRAAIAAEHETALQTHGATAPSAGAEQGGGS